MVLLAISFYPDAPQSPFTKKGHVQITREEALNKASHFLEEKGYNPKTYRSLVLMDSGAKPSEYLTERLSFESLAEHWFPRNAEILYSIRFYRFEEKEEFQIQLRENGDLYQWKHLLPRESSGASLEQAQALAIAEKYLTLDQKINLQKWKRVTEDLIQQENR
ncbi:MAG: hypothetical protein V4507_16265, partial [Verrucomicrobiota bacterium]